jgi:hypothetical protein
MTKFDLKPRHANSGQMAKVCCKFTELGLYSLNELSAIPHRSLEQSATTFDY